MKKQQHDKIFFNRAEAYDSEKMACANCGERLVFAMRDGHGNEFSVGLTTILQCLKQAEIEEYVPKLPNEWWRNILTVYEV